MIREKIVPPGCSSRELFPAALTSTRRLRRKNKNLILEEDMDKIVAMLSIGQEMKGTHSFALPLLLKFLLVLQEGQQ